MQRFAMLAVALVLLAGCARADTPQELLTQAQTPWRETISAYGREIVVDVTAQMPDVEQVNVYRVCTVEAEGDEGESPVYPQVQKRRREQHDPLFHLLQPPFALLYTAPGIT